MKKLIAILLLVCSGILLTACSGEDDGKRESIDATTIDWSIFEEENISGVLEIKINDKNVYDETDFLTVIQLFDKNSNLISEEKRKAYVPVYVEFDKAGEFQMAYTPTKYAGKETNFYIKKSLMKKVNKII